MSTITATGTQKLEDVLVSSGMLSAQKLSEARLQATETKEPLISYMIKNNYISEEQLTKANPLITKVPYVNLLSAKIDPEILKLLPEDIAERYMAVPLGQIQHRLVVAMLDADNVQAVDFL